MGGAVVAVEQGYMKHQLVDSNTRRVEAIERGEQTVVGVNAYRVDEGAADRPPVQTVDDAAIAAHRAAFAEWKTARSQAQVAGALDDLARAANDARANVFEHVVAAAEAGCTHGEICGTLRRELGFGHVQAIV